MSHRYSPPPIDNFDPLNGIMGFLTVVCVVLILTFGVAAMLGGC